MTDAAPDPASLGQLVQLVVAGTASDEELDQVRALLGRIDWPRIPGYHLLRVLGQGGMGVVYLAVEEATGRHVALKVPRDPFDLDRFLENAAQLVKLRDVDVVQIAATGRYKAGEVERPYLALEYCEGGSLADRLVGAGGTLPAEDAARLVERLARVVATVHGRGIVHRDITPANCLFHDGKVKLTDFDLARSLIPHVERTAAGVVLGTPGYIPPEALEPGRVVDDRQRDVYALGAVLYACLTGKPPHGGTDLASLKRFARLPPARPRDARPDVPSRLEAICLAAVHPEARLRYPTAQALADDLRRFLAGAAVRPPCETAVTWAWEFGRRRPVAFFGGLALVLVAVLAAGYLAWRSLDAGQRSRAAATDLAALEVGAIVREGPLAEQRARAEEQRRKVAGVQTFLDQGPHDAEVARRAADLAERFAAEVGRLDDALAQEARERNQRQRVERFHGRVTEARLAGSLPDPTRAFETFHLAAADDLLTRTFRDEYGVDVERDFDVAPVARRLRAEPNRAFLAAALIDWAFTRARRFSVIVEKEPLTGVLTAGHLLRTVERIRQLAVQVDLETPWHQQFHAELANPLLPPSRKFARLVEGADPDEVELPTLLTVAAYLSENNPDLAVTVLGRALERHRGDFWVRYYLARSYAWSPAEPDLANAIRHAEAACALQPNNPFALYALAAYLAAKGESAEANRLFDQAVALRPGLKAVRPALRP